MNTILSFMDKLYSDSKTLSIVYVVGAILLFIFILLLMFSLRKTDKKEKQKIIEEPSIEEEKPEAILEIKAEEPKQEEVVKETQKEETNTIDQSIFEKTKIIPLDELKKAEEPKQEDLSSVLDNVDNYKEPEKIQEEKIDISENISSEIPSVDEFVDNVVKKTYEKNEQFSSVYVGNNTSTIKLDKVMENLNVDEAVKESIIPEEEKTEEKVTEPIEETEPIVETVAETATVEPEQKEVIVPEETNNSLDNLKKALEEKKKEVNLKQDELKAKLEGLKQPKITTDETVKAEELLNKLNNLKEK